MERWNKLAEMVKEFYLAFGQQEFLEKEMTVDRMKLRERLFDEEQTEYIIAEKIMTKWKCWMLCVICVIS